LSIPHDISALNRPPVKKKERGNIAYAATAPYLHKYNKVLDTYPACAKSQNHFKLSNEIR